MILHLHTDEKFTDYAIAQFSAPVMNSEFVLVPSNGMMEHVKLIDKCIIVRQNSPEFEALLNRLDQYTGIIFHGMFWGQWQKPILEHIPERVKIAWVFWGGDIYSRHDIGNRFFAPITRSLYNIHSIKHGNKPDTTWEIPVELYKRIDFCLSDMIDEFELGRQYTGSLYKHLWYNYYSIEETVGSLMKSRCEGKNIWIGNSAAVKNNHCDVLFRLWKNRLLSKSKSGKIIVPLSYGEPWIRNVVKRVGTILFGRRLHVLDTYIPRNEYNALMLSCSTMIIGYLEPASQGNIITGLWLGMRVYLSEHNATYHYFKRIGCTIYSIENDLNRNNPNIFAPMKQDDIDTNRLVLQTWYGKEEMNKRNLEIVKALS